MDGAEARQSRVGIFLSQFGHKHLVVEDLRALKRFSSQHGTLLPRVRPGLDQGYLGIYEKVAGVTFYGSCEVPLFILTRLS